MRKKAHRPKQNSVENQLLLANKSIAKLNSTLNVRIGELNQKISSLCAENLRLQASEIALVAKLERERKKSRKIFAEAEVAALDLTKQLSYLRQSFNISSTSPAFIPQTRRRPLNPDPGPTLLQVHRLSKPSSLPKICEVEDSPPSSSEHEPERPQNPVFKPNGKHASQPPLPPGVASPSPLLLANSVSLTADLSTRLLRPIRRSAGQERDAAAVSRQIILGADMAVRSTKSMDPKWKRGAHSNGGLKDITNCRAAGFPTDTAVVEWATGKRPFVQRSTTNSLPSTWSPSSWSPLSGAVHWEGVALGGRERRARKSVNYAEPKLNLKMRKPDPPPGRTPVTRKRSSLSNNVTARTTTNDIGNNASNDTNDRRGSVSPRGVQVWLDQGTRGRQGGMPV